MRITCFLTVCAYLSSTVSADEQNRLNRITREDLQDDLAFEDVTTGKGINFPPEFYPEIFTLQKSQSLIPKKIFQIPKTIHKFQPKPQQFQQHKPPQPQQKLQPQYHYNRGRSRQQMKRLKTRSVVGASTFELNDNQVIAKDLLPATEVHEVHEEKPIHIQPVLRVITKKTVLDSIVDIVKQLLNPSKNEPGPVVGPIKIPGSGRKIFLRLLEPLDQSHVLVRFVTQMKVPVADLSEPKNPIIPIPPVVDPVSVLLNPHGNAILSDAVFSSSNRNAMRTKFGKGPPKQPTAATNTLNSAKSPPKDLSVSGTPSTDKPFNVAEDNKNDFPNAQPNLGNPVSGSYYHYPSTDEALKEVDAILNDTTNVSGASKPLEPWYQLSTHRLPIKQVAPLYPLTSMDHDTFPQTDTYKAPSDPGIGPSSFSGSPGSYEQYNSQSAPGSYVDSYAGSYEQHYSASPSSYSASYDKPSDANPTVNTYAVPFPKQNEFNSAPNSYAPSYQNQNEFNSGPGAYSTSYSKQPDLHGEPSSYSNFHEKPPAYLPTSGFYATSYNKQNNDQTGPSSSEAFRVIDPPSYLPNQSNQSFEQPHYSSYNFNDVSSSAKQRGEFVNDPVVWGKTKREKSQSSFENSPSIFSNEDRKAWEPLTFFQENADWRDAFKAGSELRETKQQPRKSSRNTASSTERRTTDQRLNDKRRSSAATTRSPRCSNEDGCEQAKPTTAPTLHSTVKIVEKAQETVNIESIAVKSTTSSPAEALRLVATTKSPILTTTSRTTTSRTTTSRTTTSRTTTSSTTTAKPPLLIKIENPVAISLPLIKATKSPVIGSTERLIAHKALNKQAASKAKAKPTVSSTTEKVSLNNATKAPSISVKKLQLPKRPMIMKKPTFVMKRMEASDTTKKTTTTQKPTTSNTTKRAMRTKYQGAKTKSST